MVKYSVENDIGVITLDSDNYNSIDSPLFADPKQLKQFLYSKEFRAAIIIGEGRHFSSGANLENLKDLSTGKEQLEYLLNQGKEILQIIENSPIPVASVVKGSCFGAGLEIAFSTHFIFASKTALFGFPESDHGLLPGLGGTIISNSRIKKSVLMEMILSGEFIDAESALQKNIVDFVYSGKTVFEEAKSYLVNITAKRSSMQIEFILKSINNGYTKLREEALNLESNYFAQLAIEKFKTVE